MRTQHVTIKLQKDLMTHYQMDAYAHEVPLYEAAHPDGVVEVLKTGETVEIDFGEEFDRLVKMFGEDSETGKPLVEEIYGHGGRGLRSGSFEIDPEKVTQPNASSPAVGQMPVPKTEAKPDIAKLRELCDACEVKTSKTMNAATMQRLLDAKRAEYTAIVSDRGIDANELDMLELKGLVDDIANEEEAAA